MQSVGGSNSSGCGSMSSNFSQKLPLLSVLQRFVCNVLGKNSTSKSDSNICDSKGKCNIEKEEGWDVFISDASTCMTSSCQKLYEASLSQKQSMVLSNEEKNILFKDGVDQCVKKIVKLQNKWDRKYKASKCFVSCLLALMLKCMIVCLVLTWLVLKTFTFLSSMVVLSLCCLLFVGGLNQSFCIDVLSCCCCVIFDNGDKAALIAKNSSSSSDRIKSKLIKCAKDFCLFCKSFLSLNAKVVSSSGSMVLIDMGKKG